MTSSTILLVEDNQSDIGLMKRAFQKACTAARLVIAEDGQEALDYLFGSGAHVGGNVAQLPALILLDLKLPKIDGLDLLRRIRGADRTRRVPVVVLTSSGDWRDVGRAYDLHVNSYIRKPIGIDPIETLAQSLAMYWLTLNEPPPAIEEGEM